MIFLVESLLWPIALAPAFALLIYSIELVLGLRKERDAALGGAPCGSVALLIPAHNEAAGIADTIAGLRRVAPPHGRIIVVADNCTDQTAARAREAGAEVAERFDAELRGKGFALAFGRDVLAADPPETVVVVDADCELAPGSVERLCLVAQRGVPAQAANLLIPDRTAPALVQISNFALLVKNLIRSRGMSRLGGCALLTGTGMAFPWEVFAAAPLATGNIAEDLGLGIALTRQGLRTRLVTQARVCSHAASLGDSAAQRRRWEHGFLANALRHALPTLAAGLRSGSRSLTAMGLHLLVPPLALLFLVAGFAEAVAVAAAFVWGIWVPAALLAAVLSLAALLTVVAWLRHGRETLTLTALLQAPLYVAWKVPTYVQFLFARETHWRRAKRAGDD